MTDPAPDDTRAEVWARRADRLADENNQLRDRLADAERTIRILRVQLPLMRHTLPAPPEGPDPRWAGRIPRQRPPAEQVSRSRDPDRAPSH